ncbi:uncharacterized protein (UPF0128 family) [Paraburkholderia sp. WSM4175]
MTSESKKLSDAEWTALRMRERAVLRYDNDVANNCTFGICALAHFGRCTNDEMRRPVTWQRSTLNSQQGFVPRMVQSKAELRIMS